MIIHEQVTFGGEGKIDGVRVIVADMYLGAGCTVLGDLTTAHNSLADANAVVTESVSPRRIVGGAPPRTVLEDVDLHAVETW